MIREVDLRTLWKGLTLHAGRAVWAGLKKAHKIPPAECLELPCGSVPVSPLLQLFWLQKQAGPSLLSPLTQSKQTHNDQVSHLVTPSGSPSSIMRRLYNQTTLRHIYTNSLRL